MSASKTVVVTGSSRGIGYGLAQAFLAKGCNVVVTARTAVDEAVKKLGGDRVLGISCDVADEKSVRALWDAAAKRFGRVDVWINNAGTGTQQLPLAQLPVGACVQTVTTNLTGTIICTRIALEMMTKQGGGQIFNMEGFGSGGRMKRTGMAVYGSTKCATTYFTQSIAAEVEGGPVKIGTIMPGIVVTELLLSQFDGVPRATWETAKKMYNKVGDQVETVAPYLAEKVLANTQNGASIAWLTGLGFVGRFLSPFRGRRDVLSRLPEPKVI